SLFRSRTPRPAAPDCGQARWCDPSLAVFWCTFQIGLDADEAVTISFLTFGFARLWHVFNMRDPASPLLRNEVTTNKYAWIAIGIGIVLLLAAAYLPVLSPVLGTVAPSAEGWLLIAVGSVIPLIVGQIVKLKPIRNLLPDRFRK
ncbi:MAG: cation transporting ATPase C-terminal domain-containing protein, partial [Rhodosalinus sp.]